MEFVAYLNKIYTYFIQLIPNVLFLKKYTGDKRVLSSVYL